MTINDSTQLLSKEASLERMADMLKQAEDDKKDLLDTLRTIADGPVTVFTAKGIARAAIEKASKQ